MIGHVRSVLVSSFYEPTNERVAGDSPFLSLSFSLLLAARMRTEAIEKKKAGNDKSHGGGKRSWEFNCGRQEKRQHELTSEIDSSAFGC